MERKDEVWKDSGLAKRYLENIRGGIPLAKEQMDVMLRVIESNNKPIESFVDLGCGDGYLTGVIASHFPNSKGLCLDFSDTMLESAKSKLKDITNKPDFIQMDFGTADWVSKIESKGPFDLIVSGFAIHHQTDERKKEVYQEIFQLLKQGGLFINVEHVASSTKWAESIFDEYFIDSLYEHHNKMDSGKNREEIGKEYYYRDDKDGNILSPVEDQCKWLRDIGFQDVDCYFKIFELAIFGGRKL